MLLNIGVLLNVFIGALSLSQAAITQEEKLLNQLLGPEYNPSIKPGDVVNVTVNMFIRHIEKIDIFNGDVEFQMTFRQEWRDPRLVYRSGPKYLTVIQKEKVWTPDTFFRNELEAQEHSVLVPNEYIRIFPDGAVLYSIRLTVKTTCLINLKNFPFDQQTCQVQLASYSWTKDDIDYTWKSSSPVQIVPRLYIPGGFEMLKYVTDYCDVKTNTGEYSCLNLKMSFQRAASNIVASVFIPMVMYIIVAISASWMSAQFLNARLFITFVCLLVMSVWAFYCNTLSPPVAYTKAIDVWTGMNVCFVFIAFIMALLAMGNDGNSKESEGLSVASLKERVTSGSIGGRVEFVLRLLLPLLVLLFYIIYAATYA